MKTRWTLYQRLRRYFSGKRKYVATKNGESRYVYAVSLETAQAKYLTWDIFKVSNR